MAADFEEAKKRYLRAVRRVLLRYDVNKEHIKPVIGKTRFVELLNEFPDIQMHYPAEAAAKTILAVAAIVSVKDDPKVSKQNIEDRLTDEFKDRKIRYIGYIYENMKRFGISDEDMTRIINKSTFIPVLNDYADIQLIRDTEYEIPWILTSAIYAEYFDAEKESRTEEGNV